MKLLVSISLWSIIHSYIEITITVPTGTEGFRLLTEYHSFLLKDNKDDKRFHWVKFPSPCRVSFILIRKNIWSKL